MIQSNVRGELEGYWDATRLQLHGDYAYVARHDAGVGIVDISEPTAPIHVTNFVTEDPVYDVWRADSLLYIATYSSGDGLLIADITNSTAPELVGAHPGFFTRVWVRDDGIAFVGRHLGGLELVDVSDPEAPVFIKEVTASTYLTGNVYGDDSGFVYVAVGSLFIIDARVPELATVVGTHSGATDVTPLGNGYLAATHEASFRSSTSPSPRRPRSAGSLELGHWGEAVSVSGDLAVVLDNGNYGNPSSGYAIHLIDIGDLAEPRLIASEPIAHTTPTSPSKTATPTSSTTTATSSYPCSIPMVWCCRGLSNNTSRPVGCTSTATSCCSAGGTSSGQLVLYDAETPAALDELETFYLDWSEDAPTGVAFVGDLALVATVESGLHLIDYTDPRNPEELGRFAEDESFFGLVLVEQTAYLRTADALWLVDVSQPTEPVLLGTSPFEAEVVAFAVRLPYVYVGYDWASIVVLDTSSPSENVEVDRLLEPEEYAYDFELGEDFLAVNVSGDLVLFDLVDPAHPARRGTYLHSQTLDELAITGRYVAAVHYLYGGVYQSQLVVIDATELDAPELLRQSVRFGIYNEYVFDLAIRGRHLYAGTNQGIRVAQLCGGL